MTQQTTHHRVAPRPETRRGAVGKALLVYLGTGSIVAAIGAYLLFGAMGC